MPFGVALSVHPVSSHATGEVIGQVVEDVGPHPDVAVLLVTPGHAGAIEDVARAVRRLLVPTVLIGATAPALVGEGAGPGGGVGMALWAGITGPVRPIRLGPGARTPPPGFTPLGSLILAAQGSGDRQRLIEDLAGPRIGSRVAGALTSTGPLVLDDATLAEGAVGVAFGAGVHFDTVVARGWRAIGPPIEVTEADPDRGLILRLDGHLALDRLQRLATDEVPAEEVARINRHLGIGPEDEHGGASAVIEVRGADRANGAMAAGPVPAGTVVRFWVRGDPAADLRRVLQGRSADTALAFVADAAARGYHDADGDHDAEIIADTLGIPRVLGLVAPGQIAPAAHGVRTLQGDAAIALLSDP